MVSNSNLKPQTKKVLMVAPTSFFKDYGGHIRILEEATALQALGHAISIVTYHMGDDMPGLTIHRTWPLPYRADYEVGSSRHKVTFDFYLWLKSIMVGLKLRPDIVHGHMHEGALIGGFVARILRVPLVFDFQGSLTSEMVDHGFLDKNGKIYSLFRSVEKIACRIPDATLTSSLHAKKLLIDDFDVDGDSIYPMPDCVDTDRFDPERVTDAEKVALKQNLSIPLEWPVVVYLGLLADYQGIPEIIRAAAALKTAGIDVFFLVMGFPMSEHYQQLAKQVGVADRVIFTGKVQYRDAPRYLSLGDVAISAKMSATEGSGKVLNYMAMSIPVVAFDTPVHREYLSEFGTYAPVRNHEALASGIGSLIQDPDRADFLGNALRIRASKMYSWVQAGSQIAGVYNLLTR
jgi:glycosyltransferase involved in cell wall biosynthesis